MFLKSLFDRTASLFGLIILSPVLIIVSILIRVKMSGGPVIFNRKELDNMGDCLQCISFAQ